MVSAPVTIPLQSMKLSPGSHLLVEGVTWEQYEALLLEMGEDRRVPRINYCELRELRRKLASGNGQI